MEPVPAGDLEGHQAHLPGAARHGQRALDPPDVQDVDRAGAQGNGPADRNGIDQPAVEVVLAVHFHRGSSPGTAQEASTAGTIGPAVNQRALACSMLAATQWNGSSRSAKILPGQDAGGMRSKGSRKCRWRTGAGQPGHACPDALAERLAARRPATPGQPLGRSRRVRRHRAPLIAPTDVPTTTSGPMLASDKARSMPTSCAPRIPPPPRTNAVCTGPASPAPGRANQGGKSRASQSPAGRPTAGRAGRRARRAGGGATRKTSRGGLRREWRSRDYRPICKEEG